MKIEIKAFDTLFFRDGKPFTMGDESWAEGIFPPPPSVIYGALRAAYFANHPEDLSKATKEGEDPTLNLKINDIALVHRIVKNGKERRDVLRPLPADCLVKEVKKSDYEKGRTPDRKYELYRMNIKEGAYSSKPFSPLCADSGTDKLEGSSGFYLSNYDLTQYYLQNGSFNKLSITKLSECISIEPKIGIRRDPSTKTSEDGKLYRLGMRRLKDVSILVDFEGLDLPKDGIIRLGGEGKTAHYSEYNGELLQNESDKVSNRFVIYFKTPVLFEKHGYYPDFPDKYRIVSMAMDKPLSIGGWDMKANAPKPMKKFVPAGTVYIVESDSEISLRDFKNDCENLCSEEYKKQGYGLYYVGVYNGKD